MVAARIHGELIEIRNLDDLSRVVEEAREEREPLVLLGEHNEKLIVRPSGRASPGPPEVKRSNADWKAFISSFGGWKDLIDPDEFMRQVREGRSSRDRLDGIFNINAHQSE